MMKNSVLVPDWPAPPTVKALQTTRLGGVSPAPYDSLNLGDHVGDDTHLVARNRQLLAALLPAEPVWLEQVHGTTVVHAENADCRPRADACITRQKNTVCAVMTADCLPVLLCDIEGTVVGAVHAGWRGLAEGVIEATLQEMRVAPQRLMAWLGPAIGPRAFEVGPEVRDRFIAHDPVAQQAFQPQGIRFLADIYQLACQRLQAQGVTRIYGGGFCTYHDAARFFSFRRDGRTGRMATLIWRT
jgi:hypothetical protein